MIRISITPAVYAAIAATLPGNVGVERERAPNGDYFVWLDPGLANRLAAMRRPGEGYSEVIVRLDLDARSRRPDVPAMLWRQARDPFACQNGENCTAVPTATLGFLVVSRRTATRSLSINQTRLLAVVCHILNWGLSWVREPGLSSKLYCG